MSPRRPGPSSTLRLDGLAGVLAVLATAPHPDDLAAAIVDHLAEPLGVRASSILAARPPRMVVLAMTDPLKEELQGLDWIRIDGDYPVPRAFREGQILIEVSHEMAKDYAGMRREEGRWKNVLARVPDGCTVSAPAFSSGRPVGGYSLLTDKTEWDTLDLAVLDALSHALGVWMTHPDSGLPAEESERPRLTDRQVGIVTMTAAGMTNASIGRALGVSESTIKQELARIRRLLDVDDRTRVVERARQLGLLDGEDAGR